MFRMSMMPTTLRHAATVALVCLAAGTALPALAAPITYDITFITSEGTVAPASGSLTYDPDAPYAGFTEFSVTWNGFAFGSIGPFYLNPLCPGTADPIFAFLSQESCQTTYSWGVSELNGEYAFFMGSIDWSFNALGRGYTWGNTGGDPTLRNGVAGGSTWTIEPRLVAVPEPCALTLLGLGVLGASVARRRKTS